MKVFRDFISMFVAVNEQEWILIKSMFTKKKYKIGELIHEGGEVCKKSLYLSSGVAHSYVLKALKKFTPI